MTQINLQQQELALELAEGLELIEATLLSNVSGGLSGKACGGNDCAS